MSISIQNKNSQSFFSWIMDCIHATQGGLMKFSFIWLLIGAALSVLYQHG